MTRLFLLLTIALAPCVSMAFDLTPTPSEYLAGGVTIRQVRFTDRERTASIDLPAGWDYRLDGERLRFEVAAKKFATASLQAQSVDVNSSSESAITAIAQQAIAALPPGSQAAEIVSEAQHSVPLDGHPTIECVVAYKALGEAFRSTTIIADVPGIRLTFRLSARTEDFDDLQGKLRETVFSWQWHAPQPVMGSS
jgi:hypothetical protein